MNENDFLDLYILDEFQKDVEQIRIISQNAKKPNGKITTIWDRLISEK